MTTQSADTQLFSELLPYLDELATKLRAEARVMAPHNTPIVVNLANLEQDIERVRKRVLGVHAVPKPTVFRGACPALLQDAPKATDPGADAAAPTIPVAVMQDLFHPTESQMHPGTLAFHDVNLPSWCSHAWIADKAEDRGRLLTFKFREETVARVCWVR